MVEVTVGERIVKVIGNGTVDIHAVLPTLDLSELEIKENVNYQVLKI